ncbi:1-acyl-sn-glycerol-3-phosphate acyltransferase [Ectopseudomonas hydrolytica]|uniref:1-acyl-sn-glycerol-3-phosphate acyltransferase n=1 Tax=Ectopseudomonas hydrolytica TaxID=2493633 RepID=A0ABY5AC20_9GAMM|nr:lysophospholipid acyltransferase family protein [Pseudomonas hydrolytica]USR41444.1 1-acyl-sn-glycerol-3-phosphate acyltransferase [Pseudomonas hydrolytica]
MLSLQPITRSANLARRAGVALGSVGVTLYFCLLVIVRAALGRLRREHVDRYTRIWSAALLRLVRMRMTVQGRCPDFNDGRRYLILCTHSSHYDIPASFVAMPGSMRMLAKSELYRIPFLGRAMRAAEFPSVARHNPQQARRDLARARQMMESGIVLWAAPEGTRSADGRLQPFKKGCFHLALETGAIIVPVAIRDIHHVLPARTWRLNLDQPVQLCIGAPIDASRYDQDNLAVLMADTRERMELLLYGQVAAPVPSPEPVLETCAD